MRSTIFAFAATVTSVVAQVATPSFSPVVASNGSLGLGAQCSNTAQCAGGAQCYGTTAYTIKTCGSFNAGCDSDDECATNTCQNGICSGFLASSLYRITSTSATASSTSGSTSSIESVSATATGSGMQSAPSSTVVAASGSLALGAECASTEQCAGGADCFASTAWQIKSCGKFNAACTSDAQCATNTCQNGICKGFLASSLWNEPSSTTAAVASSLVSSVAVNSANGTAVFPTSSATGTLAVYTGAASKGGLGAGAALAAAALAIAL